MNMTAVAPDRESPSAFPVFKNRREMADYAKKLGFKKIEEFEATLDSVQQREKLVEALRNKDPKLNGQVDSLIKHLKINRQEIVRKERWYETALKLPGRVLKGTWNTVRKHPYLTIAAAIAILLATGALTGYFSGSIESLMHKLGEVKTLDLTKPLKELPLEPGGGRLIEEGAHL